MRDYDSKIGRFVNIDPYNQFPSPYLGMGNDPINNIDPNGGWAATGLFQGLNSWGRIAVTTLGGAIVGAAADALSGGNGGKGAILGAGLGLASNFASDIFIQLGNLFTELPGVAGNVLAVMNRPTLESPDLSMSEKEANSLIRIYIKHGKKKSDGGDNSWDKWDGHTLLQIDNVIYHFYPTKFRGNKDLEPNGFDSKADWKETWHSNGEVGDMNIKEESTQAYFQAREKAGYGFSVFELSITPSQKTLLLQNINKSIAAPPDYRTLGTRCQSWVSGMLRNSTILPQNLRQFSWSTVPFSKALFRKLPVGSLIYKSFSSKTP